MNSNNSKFDNRSPDEIWDSYAVSPISFLISARIMSEYIAPGDSILEVGGIGRYSMYYADLGCNTTFSDNNKSRVDFAKKKADELGVTLDTVCSDISDIGKAIDASRRFDHIFLLDDVDDAYENITKLIPFLSEGGNIYVSFSSPFGRIHNAIYNAPDSIGADLLPSASSNDLFIDPDAISRKMSSLGFSTKRIFARHGGFAHTDRVVTSLSDDSFAATLGFALDVCERPEVILTAPSVIYIGKNTNATEGQAL